MWSWWGKRIERDHWRDLGVDGWIILEGSLGRSVYSVLVGKLEGKRTLGRPRRRWVYNIRMNLWGDMVYRVLVEKPKGKRPLGRPRRRWVDNIRIDLWGRAVYRVLVVKVD
jgi:hypothetical protein